VLRESFRGEDAVARIGGEEFVVVLPDISVDRAVETMEQVRRALPDSQMRSGVPKFTCSFGIADSRHMASLEEIFREADGALYAAKLAGRDRIIVAGRHTDGAPRSRSRKPTSPGAEPEAERPTAQ
jgi:diguanylate cyclase (GGDEF)-like protein